VATDRAASAIGHHQPVGLDVKATIGRFDRERGVVLVARDGGDLVLPADVGAELKRARDQHFFDVVLLQVDHARALVARIGHQVELVNLLLVEEGAANVPAHAQAAGLLGDAQAVQDFQRTLGVTHGARTHRDGFVVVEHQHLQALQPGVDRGGQADGAGANDDQRLAQRRAGAQVGRRLVGINWVDVSAHGRDSSDRFGTAPTRCGDGRGADRNLL